MLTTSFPRTRGDYAGIFVFELARSLVQRGVAVTVVAPHGYGLKKREAYDGIAVRRFRYLWPSSFERVGYGGGVVSNVRHNAISLLGMPFFLMSFLACGIRACRGADVIHAHWIGAGIIGVLARRFTHARLVVTVHGSDAYLSTHNRLFRSIARFVLRRADGVITVAKQQRDLILNLGVDPQRVTVIPNGVTNAEELLRVPFADPATHRILWIGRFTEEKNPRCAILAFRRALALVPDAHLTMVGDGPERASCETLCRELGLSESITFTGTVDAQDIPGHFMDHAVLLLTSDREGFPLVVVEAFAAGRPVIATNVGGVPDAVVSGTNGMLIPARSIEDGANALKSVFQDGEHYRSMAFAARQTAAERYVWPRITAQTVDIYRSKGAAGTAPRRGLILNGSIEYNKGDGAILAGNVKLLRRFFPDFELWGLSANVPRDEQWYGIRFLPIPSETINPLKLLKLFIFARKCAYVFWGGGEVLKDYTNKLGLVYWVAKIFFIWCVNKNVFGLFQGIGPTNAALSKRLIRFAVARTRQFYVRDEASKRKLEAWGCRTAVLAASDPAVLLEPETISDITGRMLREKSNISENDLGNFFAIAPRNWFHYTQSQWIPSRYKRLLYGQRKASDTEQSIMLQERLAAFADWIVERYRAVVIFIPMNSAPAEGDQEISGQIIKRMKCQESARILNGEWHSPQEYLNILARAHLCFGVRLHSTILSTSAGVPSVTLYYVDKGKEYFQQIGCPEFTLAIQEVLTEEGMGQLQHKAENLWEHRALVRKKLAARVAEIRESLYDTFAAIRKYH